MASHLFIDTNVYLKFYHYSSDDLEELNKLLVLLDNDEIELYMPEQVKNEFFRNREVKLADALKTFQQYKFNNQFPQFVKEYVEYHEMKSLTEKIEREKQKLLKNVMLQIEMKSLQADKVINSLFAKANVFEITEELVERSKLRFDLGNPPGKNKSYGDALNWETLLACTPEEVDLYFIADDKDYFSALNNSNFNEFLAEEWFRHKNSNIVFYKTLSDFFKNIAPDIKIAAELEKDLLISKLLSSSSFSRSRSLLQQLNTFDQFSSQQANDYLSSCLANNQIFWISQDIDINEILHNFVKRNKSILSNDLLDEFYARVPVIYAEESPK